MHKILYCLQASIIRVTFHAKHAKLKHAKLFIEHNIFG